MDALVAVSRVIRSQRRQNSKFNAGSLAVFLHRSNDLHSTARLGLSVVGFDDLAKGSLAKQFDDQVCKTNGTVRTDEVGRRQGTRGRDLHRSVKFVSGVTI